MARHTDKRCCAACAEETEKTWSSLPGIIGGAVAAIVFAYLHIHFSKMVPLQAASVAATSIGIFLVSYLVLRSIRPQENPSSIKGLLQSAAIAVPFFIMAFIGLGFEITVMADFTAMYVLGSWLGSTEAAAKAEQE